MSKGLFSQWLHTEMHQEFCAKAWKLRQTLHEATKAYPNELSITYLEGRVSEMERLTASISELNVHVIAREINIVDELLSDLRERCMNLLEASFRPSTPATAEQPSQSQESSPRT